MNRAFDAENAHALTRLKSLVDQLTPDQLNLHVVDGWTVSSLLVHLAFWDFRALQLIERYEREGTITESPYDVDIINDAMKPICLAMPPQDAAALVLDAAHRTDSRIAGLGDDFIAAVLSFEHGKPFNPSRAEHRTYHLDEIENALV